VSDLTYRPLADQDEFALFTSFPEPTSGVGARSRTFAEYVADGDYLPERVWIAERDGAVVARAAFWTPPGSPVPESVDYFDFGPGPEGVEIGAALLRAAYPVIAPPGYSSPRHPVGGRPDYHLFLPADWRDRPDARRDAEARIAAAELAGLKRFVERLNLRWTPDCGLPDRPGRLRFEPVDGRYEELVTTIMRVNESTLDLHVRSDIARVGARAAVETMLAEADGAPGSVGRQWWRLAYAAGTDDVVGFVLPARAPFATLYYLGVLPGHRGHHYSDDLVIEALHIFTAAGESMAYDNTDVGNAPMAASFARVGYRVVGRRIIFV
jgi:ribosomal protein S18 acetylase RimI-like enzyme